MSVMCIGQLAMQAAVNAIGPDAIAGYTAATKVDQLSVLINNAFGVAIARIRGPELRRGQMGQDQKRREGFPDSDEVVNILLGFSLSEGAAWWYPCLSIRPRTASSTMPTDISLR